MVNSDMSHAYPLISRTQWLLLFSLGHINIVLEVQTKTEGCKTAWPVFVDDRIAHVGNSAPFEAERRT